MNDLEYDISARDTVMVNGDFVMTDNPSEQNAGIILIARAFSSANPILGIGINQIRGATVLQANYEMNRWKQQIYNDGGRASVTTVVDAQGNTVFKWEANYL